LLALALVGGNASADDGAAGPVVGIGVGIRSVDHHPIVSEVLPGNAAFKHGVKVGDRLISVAGKNVDGLPLAEVASLLRGAAGTQVKIVVLRPGETDPRKFTLKRQMVGLLPPVQTEP
jgi:carboxyl-terminal processing protease